MPVENLVHRRHRNRRAGLVALLGVLAGVLAPLGLLAQGNPSYSPEETTTEYDVDPAWPKRPAGMKEPEWVSGLALDAQENVWLFTKGPDPVQVYRPDGSFLRTWGQGQFNQPHQLRIDREGNVWVADFGLHVVQKYTPEGKLLLTLGTRGAAGEDATHFNRPTDMAIAPNGDVFVTDGYGNRRVVHFDRNGRYLRAWGTFGSAPGQFVLPHAIQMDSRGRLYVADRNSGRIQVFNQKGKLLDVWSGLLMPWGLFITPQDEVWVCGSTPHWWFRKGQYQEYKDQILMRFSTDGRVRQVWGMPLGDVKGPKPGDCIGVHCIAQDSHGNLYVGDIYGHRAQKLIPVRKRGPADIPKQ